MTVTYCELVDLDWGNIPAPPNAEFWLLKGAEEIDGKIGFLYATPVILGLSTEQRPAKLLLKRINSWLAMGRAILSIAAGTEDDQLHQLGKYYVDEAGKALDAIVDGSVILPGVDPATPSSDQQTGPMITNVDAASAVEAFNTTFGNPADAAIQLTRVPVIGNPYTW
jgi:hypothetical protein